MKIATTIKIFLIGLCLSVNINAQEICNNGIDDDGDGFIDCVDPDCSEYECDSILNCNNALYQVISGVLKRFNPITSTYEVIGNTGEGSYNGAGYNVEDGYIYSIKPRGSSNHMLKINAYGEAIDLGKIANWSGITYSADVNQQGNWIAYNSGSNPVLRTIDLDQFPLTMTLTNLTNLASENIPTCADITYNAAFNKYYGFAAGFKLVMIDPESMTADIIWNEGSGVGAFGAAWSDSEGNSYFSNNTTGEISRFTFDETGNPIRREVVAYGEITSNNDGMSCSLSLPPFETNCEDGIDNDGDGLIDSDDPDCATAPPFVELVNTPFTTEGSNSWGISAIDFNNDGYDDIFLPSYENTETNKLFINDRSGGYTEQVATDLVTDLLPSIAPTWGDVDNDGQIDVAVANNNGEVVSLYLNQNQDFINSTDKLLGATDGYSHNLCFVDYNRDGWLDLYTSDYFGTKFNQLYKNQRNGKLERVYDLLPALETSQSLGVIWADVNNDGWPDCFVPNYGTENVLYINQEGKSFTRIGLGDSSNSTGASFGDFDNDLDLDLFVANASNQYNLIYENDGNGNFTKIESGWIAEDKGDSHGSVWGDFNNDGWLDLTVMNDRNGSKFLYINNGDGSFVKVTNSPFIRPIGNSFAVATSDIELDGDLDLIIATHENETNKIFLNNSAGRNFFGIRLEGTNSNRSAIGARIFVTATVDGQEITMMREIMGQTGGGAGAQSSLRQHFGLGDAKSISNVEIHWPSGHIQFVENPTVNTYVDVVEENGAMVSGIVYVDQNNNCYYTGKNQTLSNTIITFSPSTIYTMTDENGYFEASLPPGSYRVQQEMPENYSSDCDIQYYDIDVTDVGQSFNNLDFANQVVSNLPDLSIMIGNTALRRGFENEMVLNISNLGSVDVINADVSLNFDSGIDLVSASMPWDYQSGSTYDWVVDTLKAGETKIINLVNKVALSTNLEDEKTTLATISTSMQEINYNNNSQELLDVVVGSMDPNDLLVTPRGIGSSHFIDPETRLNYKIRFQNVGNYPASFVIVKDTISEHLDLSTLRVGAVSHDYVLSIEEGNILTWFFKDINLKDSVHHEEESHGFIDFSILPHQQLENNTKIFNSAAIQFDYNPYIITNTTLSTIYYDSGANEKYELMSFPNPASTHIECYLVNKEVFETSETDDRGDFRIDILNNMGQIVQSNRFKADSAIVNLQLQDLRPGLYFIRYQDDLGLNKISSFIKH